MDFPRPQSRARTESIVPMINVVFLLLIFFLMTARITPPAPFDVAVPLSDGREAAEGQAVLFVSAEGRLAYAGAEGPAALARLSERAPQSVLIRADGALPMADLAALLGDLAALGLSETRLVTRLMTGAP